MKTIQKDLKVSFNQGVPASTTGNVLNFTDKLAPINAGELYNIKKLTVEIDSMSAYPAVVAESSNGSIAVGYGKREQTIPSSYNIHDMQLLCVTGMFTHKTLPNSEIKFYNPFFFGSYCRQLWGYCINFYMVSNIVLRVYVEYDVVQASANELPELLLTC